MSSNYNKNRIIKNSLLLYVRMLFTMWLNLWITRLVLANLGVEDMGGTMRLGAYPCVIKKDSMMAKAYGKKEVSERHRHRYEFNNDYRDIAEGHGLTDVTHTRIIVIFDNSR